MLLLSIQQLYRKRTSQNWLEGIYTFRMMFCWVFCLKMSVLVDLIQSNWLKIELIVNKLRKDFHPEYLIFQVDQKLIKKCQKVVEANLLYFINYKFIRPIGWWVYIHYLIQMDQGDEMEEMWLFQGLELPRCQDFNFLSKKGDESLDEAIQQFFAIQHELSEHADAAKLETLSQPSSKTSGDIRVLRTRKPNKRNSVNIFKVPEKKSKQRRKTKPSPYHNYQKHLVTAVKHILRPPILTGASSNIALVEALLWRAFTDSQIETKKILYFVFNHQNNGELNQEELRSSGFDEIYQNYSIQEISLAKSLMCQLALDQLTEESINHYLQTRRIKDPLKFKRYLQLFMQELQDGFINKRISLKNRNYPERTSHSYLQS